MIENPSPHVDEEIKAAELRLKKLDIEQKERDISAARRFDLGRAAVWVTMIGGISAVLFQAVGFLISETEKEKAEAQAKSDFNFKGVELFLKEQEHLVTCDVDQSTRNINLFRALFDAQITNAFSDIVAYRVQKCAAESANAAATKAEASGLRGQPQKLEAIADQARYSAIAQQAPLLSATAGPALTKFRVFIHINSNDDRVNATALAASFMQRGYSVPGIELVTTAPAHYQVRYYYRDQAGNAEALASIAASELGIDINSIQIPPSLETTYKSLPRQTMEFWFPKR